jgi:hypothetical protein
MIIFIKIDMLEEKNYNLLILGLLSTGSSALVDLLKEYDNVNIVPEEFNDFRAPGLVADQLSDQQSKNFPSKISSLISVKKQIHLIYEVVPFFKKEIFRIWRIKVRYKKSSVRLKQLWYLKNLNSRLDSDISFEEKIKFANIWVKEIASINSKNKKITVFNQPLLTGIETPIWEKVFDPLKLIIVFRDPKDQLAEIIKKGYLFMSYGAPNINMGGVIIETLYGRDRKGAINTHIDAIAKRFEWIDNLRKELDPEKFLLIDFEGFVNNYEVYKTLIENFTGNAKEHHLNSMLYFNPSNAKKSIGIYKEYLESCEIEALAELDKWYMKTIKNNILIHKAIYQSNKSND